jgi:hypothetical protein
LNEVNLQKYNLVVQIASALFFDLPSHGLLLWRKLYCVWRILVGLYGGYRSGKVEADGENQFRLPGPDGASDVWRGTNSGAGKRSILANPSFEPYRHYLFV